MKVSLLLMVLTLSLVGQAQNKWHVAIRSGLSIREKPDAKSAVVSKIPYGTALTTTATDPVVSITTEGITGEWVKTSYSGKSGYVINSYLLPDAPPKATVKTMKDYLAQLSPVAGNVVVIKKGNMNNVEEGGTETKKQLYKNGTEYHSVVGYEWNNDTYFLPGFTTEQGFILLRLIPEFKAVFSDGDLFPVKNATLKKGEIEYEIKVETEDIGIEKWIKKITIEFADGSINTFEMFQLNNQLVISFGGGV